MGGTASISDPKEGNENSTNLMNEVGTLSGVGAGNEIEQPAMSTAASTSGTREESGEGSNVDENDRTLSGIGAGNEIEQPAMSTAASTSGTREESGEGSNVDENDRMARFYGKTCAKCFEIVMQKPERKERLFAILMNCNHCFCITCIRKWRRAKNNNCPVCKVRSTVFIPSKVWVDIQEDRDKLVRDYKAKLRTTPCKYFSFGRCRHGDRCFSLHEQRGPQI